MGKLNVLQFLGTMSVATAATFMGAGEASAVVIDDFTVFSPSSNPGGVLQATGGVVTDSPTSIDTGSDLTGISRVVEVEETAGGTYGAFIDGGQLNASQIGFGPGIPDADGSVTLTYTATGTPFDLLEGLPQDLDLVELDFTVVGNTSMDTEFIAVAANLTSSSGTATLGPVMAFSQPFLLSDFTITGAFDFADVEEVELTFDTPPSGTVRVQGPIQTQVIPFEAETSAGLALLGAWAAWKRWKTRRS